MKRIVRLFLVLCLSVGASWAWGQELPSPKSAAVSGEYQTVTLKLEGGGEGGTDLPLFLSFREGQGAAVWFAAPQRMDAHRIWIETNSLRLSGDKLQGDLNGRLVKVWAPIADTGTLSLTLSATVERGQVAGTFNGKIGAANVSGKLAGSVLTAAQLRERNSVAKEAGWPTYFAAPGGATNAGPLVDDLAKARPEWKAEESLPCMWGKGPEDRYPHRACMTGCAGGASSPVIADGRVFVYFYRPSGAIGAAPLPYGAGAPKVASEADVIEFAQKHTPSPHGHRAMIDWYRPFADDVVVAFDAATGQTLWRTELPDRSGNMQAHKWRGMNPTPTFAHGKVFAQGYGGRVYALDAATGQLTWEYGAAATKLIGKGGGPSGTGPLVSGNVVVVAIGGSTIGLDATSGREVWKSPGQHPLLWRSAGGEQLIVFAVDKLPFEKVECLEPATGKRLWSQPIRFFSGMNYSPTGAMAQIAGDLLIGFAPPSDPQAKPSGGVPQAWKLSAIGAEKAWQGEFLPNDENMPVTLGTDRAYVMGREEIRAYELSSGKLLGSLQGKDAFPGLHGPGSNPWLAVVGNRLLLNPEGQHGGQAFMLLDLDLKPLSAWHPPHPSDSAYACMAAISPVVDGRIFVRGHDGLYCYDLR